MSDADYVKDLESFGEALKIWRCRKKFTQEELARKACVSKKYLVEVEKGMHSVGQKIILRLCEALGINRFDLFILAWEKEYINYRKALMANTPKQKTSAAANLNHRENARPTRLAERKSFSHLESCGGGQRCYNYGNIQYIW